MTTTTFRRPTAPLRSPESVWADVVAACEMADAVAAATDHSGAAVTAPAAPEPNVNGAMWSWCDCPRCAPIGGAWSA